VLDVSLREMIHSRAFRAVLKNGHTIVAFIPRSPDERLGANMEVGHSAKVRMSPFDMSCGELVTV
jgi:translation initiation factor IF-1